MNNEIKELSNELAEVSGKIVNMPVSFPMISTTGAVVKDSVRNVVYALNDSPQFKNSFKYNVFTEEIETTQKIQNDNTIIDKGILSDADITTIGYLLEQKYNVVFKANTLRNGVLIFARQNSYNPVKNYMENCFKNWDGTSRAADLLPTYLGVEHTELTTLITKLFFVGAVAKTYQPKSKFDFVLDLVGSQGIGKTTFAQKMANSWYTDSFTSFNDKDSYMVMNSALIINDDEMAVTDITRFPDLKKFISKTELEYRVPYGSKVEKHPKHFIMLRTTNNKTYLKDKTGDRRFLPVLCDNSKQIKHPYTDLRQDDINQLWGEFVSIYKEVGMGLFKLSKKKQDEINSYRNSFRYVSYTDEEIARVLETWEDDFITIRDFSNLLGDINLLNDKKLTGSIKYYLDNSDDWEYTESYYIYNEDGSPSLTESGQRRKKRGYKRV